MYDIVIKNGTILDGTGSPSYRADLAISGGKIVRIAKGLDGGSRVIDAAGLTVTPGFIDSHSHADNAALAYPDLIEKVEQGITTSVAGQCGGSAAPVRSETLKAGEECRAGIGTFLDTLRETPLGSNLSTFVGHGTLRRFVMGTENRAPTAREMQQMKDLLQEAIDHGAQGVSFGLIYMPGSLAQTDELIEMAKVASKNHALVAAHIRNEDYTVIQAVQEFLTVIRASGARGVISHHKSTREENWGKVTHTLRMIDQANREGFEVYCDVYPYIASSTTFQSFLPKELLSAGTERVVAALSDPEGRQAVRDYAVARKGEDLGFVMITSCKAHPEYAGMRIPEIAQQRGVEPYDALFDLLIDSKLSCTACFFTMCEEDVKTVMAHPRAMICTDSSVAKNISSGVYHPRLRGSFPRVLGRYVREQGVTTLPEMIRKMTSMPATVYGLKGKGLLMEGFDADICIFDADRIIDRADFKDCTRRAEGLSYVLVGGKVAAEDAVYNGTRAGRLLIPNR